MELSGAAKLGKGQKHVVEKERNKAAKRVRDGLIEKQKARAKQELEEVSLGFKLHVRHWLIRIVTKAKNLGNYHPTIKKLFKSSTSPGNAKRDRGLKMGVGKFSGGLLRLSQKEVGLAQDGRGERGSNSGRHTSSRGRRQTKR